MHTSASWFPFLNNGKQSSTETISDETEEPKASHMQGGSLEAKDKVLMGDSRCLHITVDSNIKVSNLKWEEKDLQKTKNQKQMHSNIELVCLL